VPDDPTQDVVGNFPLLFAPKSAALAVDNGTPGVVDPGDTLRYTIQVYNNGAVPATIARLADLVPNDVTYVPDSTTLNGEPLGQPDGGVFPLIDRIDISSTDLTPPLPGAAEGVADRHADRQPGDGVHGRAAEPAHRRRRQRGDRSGTDRGRRGRRTDPVDRQIGYHDRRWAGHCRGNPRLHGNRQERG
jgi:uncharacterized repeat protein (TIGR01451 family)